MEEELDQLREKVLQLEAERDRLRLELGAAKAGSDCRGPWENFWTMDNAAYMPKGTQCLCGNPSCTLIDFSREALGLKQLSGDTTEGQVRPMLSVQSSTISPQVEFLTNVMTSQLSTLSDLVQKQQKQLDQLAQVLFMQSSHKMCHRCRQYGHIARHCSIKVRPEEIRSASLCRARAMSSSQGCDQCTPQRVARRTQRKRKDWGKLFIGGLSCENEEVLEEAFGQFGTVKKVNIVKDKVTGKSRGFGFVRYVDVKCAEAALGAMNGELLGGGPIRVERVRRGQSGDGVRRPGPSSSALLGQLGRPPVVNPPLPSVNAPQSSEPVPWKQSLEDAVNGRLSPVKGDENEAVVNEILAA